MMDSKLEKFEEDLGSLLRVFDEYHSNMETYRDYYNNSVLYAPRPGGRYQSETITVNLMKTFADKNINYLSGLPAIKVPPTSPDEGGRTRADKREKLLYATRKKNGMALKRRRQSWDSTVLSLAITETYPDLKERCVKVNRIDPRYCVWRYGNDNTTDILEFYIFYPMTKKEVKRRWDKDVGDGNLAIHTYASLQKDIDGEERVLVVKRYTSETRAVWAGDTWIEQEHPHGLGVLPIDIVMPWTDGSVERYGDFYLRPLVGPQAELNETVRKKVNIMRRMGNPAVWASGLVRQQFEDVKKALSSDGGFIGLKENGKLGILQPPETAMFDQHIDFLIATMQRISGFGAASFGESVGANTSGDALGMYFTPTTRAIEDQQIAWREHDESVNWKILNFYEKMLFPGEQFKLAGGVTRGTFMGIGGEENAAQNNYSQGLGQFITKEDIEGAYDNTVIYPSPTPKDEISYKKLLIEARASKSISLNTFHEEWGMESPPDEVEKLRGEQMDMALNQEGNARLMDATANFQSTMNPPAPAGMPQGQPAMPAGAPNGPV